MKFDLLRERLRNQRLVRSEFSKPEDVVTWMGAVQAQDFAGAKWGVAQRAGNVSEAEVEAAFNAGRILRTHAIRPTWHFVTPADIRWILELSAPRTHAATSSYYRKSELDEKLFNRCRKVIERRLEGGRHLTRDELATALEQAGIPARGFRLGHILLWAEVERVVCSGPRRGKQFTYALLDERAPGARRLQRDEALFELVSRYFLSHGPATVRDFVWWSGLKTADALRGIELLKPALTKLAVGDRTYWFRESVGPAPRVRPSLYLLPDYDEYLIAYRDRDSRVFGVNGDSPAMPTFETTGYLLVIDGLFAGTWRPKLKSGTTTLELKPFAPLGVAHSGALSRESRRFSDFIGRPVDVSFGK